MPLVICIFFSLLYSQYCFSKCVIRFVKFAQKCIVTLDENPPELWFGVKSEETCRSYCHNLNVPIQQVTDTVLHVSSPASRLLSSPTVCSVLETKSPNPIGFVQQLLNNIDREPYIAVSASEKINCFGRFKELIKNEFHIPAWRNLDDDMERQRHTECHQTANYVRERFIGGSEYSSKRHIESFKGRSDAFIKDQHPISSVAKKLLEPSSSSEHLIFHFNLPQRDHSFAIEKDGSSRNTCWRIYQTYAQTFSLAEWLDIDPWNLDNDEFTATYNRFGKGRCLSKDDLKEFMVPWVKYPSHTLSASIYSVDPNFCSRSERQHSGKSSQ